MTISHLSLAAFLTAGLWAADPGAMAKAPQKSQDRDLAAVMKVVKRPGQPARSASTSRSSSAQSSSKQRSRYLKMEIGGSHSEELKISVPFALVELLASFDEEATLNDVGGESDVRLIDLVEALRDLGPSELLEIRGDDGWLRIWLE